jgi:hypothetical protein
VGRGSLFQEIVHLPLIVAFGFLIKMASLHVWTAYTAQEHFREKVRRHFLGVPSDRSAANVPAFVKEPKTLRWSAWFSSWYCPVTTEPLPAKEV